MANGKRRQICFMCKSNRKVSPTLQLDTRSLSLQTKEKIKINKHVQVYAEKKNTTKNGKKKQVTPSSTKYEIGTLLKLSKRK